MSFSPPAGIAFHTGNELPVLALVADLKSVVAFLHRQQSQPIRLRLYDDWWQHDGLHFPRRRIDHEALLTMTDTARTLFEATPKDHEVFIGVAPEDGHWYLRFRVELDGDDQFLVGRFAIIMPDHLAVGFRQEVGSHLGHPLVEEASEDYYKRIMK